MFRGRKVVAGYESIVASEPRQVGTRNAGKRQGVVRTSLVALVLISSMFISVAHGYSGGDGSSGSPYQIASKADLLQLAATTADYNDCFVLTADISLTGETFTTAVIAPDTDPVTSWYQGTPFSGVFDGNGHAIRGLTISSATSGYCCLGLFGKNTGTVRKVYIVDCSIAGFRQIGAIAGVNQGSITACSSTGVLSGGSEAGGLVGRNYGQVSQSWSLADISLSGGAEHAGGLIGATMSPSAVSRCYATGNVETGVVCIGGLIGSSDTGCTVVDSYALGRVSGGYYVGGLVGYSDGTESRCYSAGCVRPYYECGGLIGYRRFAGGTTASFWDTQTSGQSGSSGGAGRTTAQMQMQSTFTGAGWDFVGETVNGTNDWWWLPDANTSYPELTFVVAAPVFTPGQGPYNNEPDVVVTCTTAGATIHYTTNGTDPTEGDPTIASGGSVHMDHGHSLKARAWKPGRMPSSVRSATYVVQVATPALTPGGGTYNGEQNVVVTCATPDATIRYTTNGIDPTESDPVIASGASILVEQSLTLKAKAWKAPFTPSTVGSAAYTLQVAAPSFSPTGGAYGAEQNVIVTCATPDATIHYTTNGVDPNESDSVIASGATVLVGHNLTLKAKAWKGVMTPSVTASNMFVIGRATQAGSITGWGYNLHGQATPPSGTDFVAIAAGGSHSLALRADGSVAGWGSNSDENGIWRGQATMPDGNGVDNSNNLAIAAGGYHSLALRSDGSIAGWGSNYFQSIVGPLYTGQATPPAGTGFVAIAAGEGHSLALRADGSIAGWGANWCNSIDGPVYYGQATPPDGTDFTAIAAGNYHGLALRVNGSIVGWGGGYYYGQRTPPDGNDFVAIAAGGSYDFALRADGSIVGWGNIYSPPDGNDFIAIAAGWFHSLALRADGSIVGWGWNAYGQATPPAGNDFVAIAAGMYHSLAIRGPAIADLNKDFHVNFVDLGLFVAQWLRGDCAAPEWCEGADFDKNGWVDIRDFATFASYWLEAR